MAALTWEVHVHYKPHHFATVRSAQLTGIPDGQEQQALEDLRGQIKNKHPRALVITSGGSGAPTS